MIALAKFGAHHKLILRYLDPVCCIAKYILPHSVEELHVPGRETLFLVSKPFPIKECGLDEFAIVDQGVLCLYGINDTNRQSLMNLREWLFTRSV